MKRSAWPQVERCLRARAPETGGLASALRSDGLWAEATVIETPGLLDWASEVVSKGKVLCASNEGYPPSLLSRLGQSAPPALWLSGSPPKPPFVAIVGSREVSRAVLAFARQCATRAVELGFSVVSGGARGCDRAAAAGAGDQHTVEILPFGLDLARTEAPVLSRCLLSVCAPQESFSTATAMERNALIYAMADAAIVVHARFKSGGTWHGAVEAHRRRLTPLLVRTDRRNQAHRALIGLGGLPLSTPEDLEQALQLAVDTSGFISQPRLVS